MWFVDTEVFVEDWMLVANNPVTQEEVVIVNDRDELIKFHKENKKEIWVGWNIREYDQYIIKAIILGFNPKDVNDWIIVKKKRGYEYSSLFYQVPLIFYDAMPAIPVSLKVMEGFLGKNIHETSVPFDIDRKLSDKELSETIEYCKADVYNLIDVFCERKSEFEAQLGLVKEFDLPLYCLSKTQANLAAQILGAHRVKLNDEWNIRLPDNLQLGKYEEIGQWFLDSDNHNYEASLETTVGGLSTVIALGGIHGGISQFQYTCAEDEIILDADIGQMYPNIMIHYDLQSRGVKDKTKLPEILEKSMQLKREGRKKEREPLKRICNIVYGAEGTPFNKMYDPLHRNLVCIFGQVLMVDLVDKIEDIVRPINLNTDGIFFIVKKKDIPELKRRVGEWEERTKLKMEYDEYVKFVSKDVNNYIAVRPDGGYHAKGAYVKDLSPLDYDMPIVNEAVKKYLLDGTDPAETINNCDELIKFQKIVKLSSKYQWVEHERSCDPDVVYTNKAYRVFAAGNLYYGRLLKCKKIEKDGVLIDKKDKFGLTPEHCFIRNEDIRGEKVPIILDRDWYIQLANKRIKDFIGG